MCIDMGLGCHYAHIIHVLYLATFRYGVAMMNFVLLSFPDSIVVTHKRRTPHGLQLFLGECAITHPLRDLRPDDDRTEHRPCGCCSCAQYSGRPCPQSIQHRRRSHRATEHYCPCRGPGRSGLLSGPPPYVRKPVAFKLRASGMGGPSAGTFRHEDDQEALWPMDS